jgi:toxin HigB-1
LEVRFRTRKLRECYEDVRVAQREFGKDLGTRFIRRVDLINDADDWKAMQNLESLRCHALKGDRLGQWAIKLDGFHRLIVSVETEAIEIVTVEEVSKHYGT